MNRLFSFVVGGLLLTGLLAISPIDSSLHGQVWHADSPLLSFDVATIRPAKGDSLRTVRSASELQMLDVTVRYLMEQAYNIPWTNGSKDRIRGGPGWMDSDHYDIGAKISPEAAAALEQMPEAQRRREMNLRLQALLADRFKLNVHFETRQEPVFAIIAGPFYCVAGAIGTETDEHKRPGRDHRDLPLSAQQTTEASTLVPAE